MSLHDASTGHGGAGNDDLYVRGTSTGYGDAGNDRLNLTGESTGHGGTGNDRLTAADQSIAFGDAGNDTLSSYGNALADGEAGNDELHLYGQGTVLGGEGDDRLYVHSASRADAVEPTPRELTTGEGADTIVIDAEDLHRPRETSTAPYHLGTVTDFDPDEDVLLFDILSDLRFAPSVTTAIGDIRTEPVDGQNAVDVHFNLYQASDPGHPASYVIRLNGVSELEARHILTVADADAWFDAPEGVATDQSVLIGTDGDDTLTPTDEIAVLAGEGDDVILAGASVVHVHGGTRDDTITANPAPGQSVSHVHGGEGDDTITVSDTR